LIHKIHSSNASSYYGELSKQAVKIFIQESQLTDNDIVCDLGSGAGKMVIQIAIESNAIKVIGIELSPTRYNCAVKSLETLKNIEEKQNNRNNKYNSNNKIKFIEGDIIGENWNDATVVYCSWTAFSDELKQKIVEKALIECNNLRWLIVSEEMSWIEKRFVMLKDVQIETTWREDTILSFYKPIKK